MNDNEKISVELEAKTSKFQQKISEVIDRMKTLGQMAKTNFKLGMNVDTERLTNNLNAYEQKLKELESQKQEIIKGSQEWGGILSPEEKRRIQEINQEMSIFKEKISNTKDLLNTMNTDKFALMGRGVKNASAGIEQAKNNVSVLGAKLLGLKDKFKSPTTACEKFKNNLSKAFSKGINSIKRFGMSLLGIRTIFSLVSRAMNSYMSQDTELANKMQAVWIGLGSLLAPILERIANLLITIVKYVNTFVSSLTGVDLLAKGMDKAKKSTLGTAKAVDKLQGGLSGLDEVTNIAQNDSGGGAGGLNWTDAFDGTQIFDSLDGIENTIFDKINSGLEIALGWLRNTDFRKIGGDVGKKIGDWITSIDWGNVARTLARGLTGMFDFIVGFILGLDWAGIGTSIKDFFISWFDEMGTWLKEVDWTQLGFDLYTKIKEFFENLDVGTIIKEIAKFLGKVSVALLKTIGGFCAGIILDIWNGLKQYVAENDWGTIMKDIILGLFYFVSGAWILDLLWEYVVSPFIEGFKELFDINSPSKVMMELGKELINGIFEGVKGLWDLVKGVFEGFKKNVEGIFEGVKSYITTKATEWGDKIKEKFNWDNVKGTFENLKSNISKKMDEINKIKATITTEFKGKIDDLKSKASKVLNGGKDVLSSVLGWSASKISSAKNWLASLDVGTNYVPNDQLAMIHKGEAIIPKKFNNEQFFNQGNDETNKLLEELIEAVNNKDSDVYLDGKKIGESTRKYIASQNRIMGRSGA